MRPHGIKPPTHFFSKLLACANCRPPCYSPTFALLRGRFVVPFKPYLPHDSKEREVTLKAVLAGIVMAFIFGAANAYLGMKAGQTVAATIPAAVIAVALFRPPFFRGGMLEQNIARTAASVGEALVAGAIFTIPAFLMVNVGGERL